MNKLYATIETAERRVQALRKAAGIWPGIVALENGKFRLTYDPYIGD